MVADVHRKKIEDWPKIPVESEPEKFSDFPEHRKTAMENVLIDSHDNHKNYEEVS